jgi:hypothetical protein
MVRSLSFACALSTGSHDLRYFVCRGQPQPDLAISSAARLGYRACQVKSYGKRARASVYGQLSCQCYWLAAAIPFRSTFKKVGPGSNPAAGDPYEGTRQRRASLVNWWRTLMRRTIWQAGSALVLLWRAI